HRGRVRMSTWRDEPDLVHLALFQRRQLVEVDQRDAVALQVDHRAVRARERTVADEREPHDLGRHWRDGVAADEIARREADQQGYQDGEGGRECGPVSELESR